MNFPYKPTETSLALYMEDYYIWDCSVIFAQGQYHMFSSRWPKKYGFGCNWLFRSEIIHSVADRPEGPYQFKNVVLPPRGRQYFDGMNTHNTCIKYWNGKFYLYYMGTSYPYEIGERTDISEHHIHETWNRKRIGLAVADSINGEFLRRDRPILEPRDCSCWDCTVTTNPSVVILPSGKTYMIYKSRQGVACPLKLGIAVADRPDGEFTRLTGEPILQFEDENFHIEDPFLWYDGARQKFCLIAKDDCKNGVYGITGQWGSGFYAESDDCVNFTIQENPTVYTRNVRWADGKESLQGNLERPSLLFDESGNPTHLFCASGFGERPYDFAGNTFVVATKLERK